MLIGFSICMLLRLLSGLCGTTIAPERIQPMPVGAPPLAKAQLAFTDHRDLALAQLATLRSSLHGPVQE